MLSHDEEDSCDSVRRSGREKPERVIIYFYSDNSTVVERDAKSVFGEAVKKNEVKTIKFGGKTEKVLIVKVGGTAYEIAEANDRFDALLEKGYSSYRAANECDVEELSGAAKRVKRRKPSVTTSRAKLPPIIKLAEEITRHGERGEIDTQNQGRGSEDQQSSTDGASCSTENVQSRSKEEEIFSLERRLCELRKGALADNMVTLFPGYNVMISKQEKICALQDCKGNAGKLQRILLRKTLGDNYIKGHSATGQRKSSKGNPGADRDVLAAVQCFVAHRFKGTSNIPSINKTYNDLSKNLRRHQQWQEGIWRYPRKQRINDGQ